MVEASGLKKSVIPCIQQTLSEGVRVMGVLIDHIESVEEMLLRGGMECTPCGVEEEENTEEEERGGESIATEAGEERRRSGSGEGWRRRGHGCGLGVDPTPLAPLWGSGHARDFCFCRAVGFGGLCSGTNRDGVGATGGFST